MSESAWRTTLPAHPAALAKLVPELCSCAEDADADVRTLRFKLFDELAQFLKAASQEVPRLVVLDDLQWADAATIELLAHAARALERRRVLFVATLRERDAALDSHRDALLRLERVATWLRLAGLSNSEVADLTLALTGVQRDQTLIDALCQRAQGNPLFVRQMLGWLAQRGRLSGDEVLKLTAADLPPALNAVIQRRIEALGEETRAVLSLAAVAGREFDAHLVAQVLGRSVEQVLRVLERAIEFRVVDQPALLAPQGFAFTHDLLCDALRESLGALQRGHAHAKLAHALLERGAAGDPRRSSEIARHLLLAVPSELEACMEHCRNAAAAGRASSGYEAAAQMLL
jgi:predicted ATPase